MLVLSVYVAADLAAGQVACAGWELRLALVDEDGRAGREE